MTALFVLRKANSFVSVVRRNVRTKNTNMLTCLFLLFLSSAASHSFSTGEMVGGISQFCHAVFNERSDETPILSGIAAGMWLQCDDSDEIFNSRRHHAL